MVPATKTSPRRPTSPVTSNVSSTHSGSEAYSAKRRIRQSSGAEVIHLGHDRSVDEGVNCAIQEDVNAIAMTSYQGGHVEYLKYMHDRLEEERQRHIRLFAGSG